MNNTSSNQPHGRMPSDAQLDTLLLEFFRLEMPVELNRPFHRPAVASSASTVTVVSGPQESAPYIQRNRRFVVASAFTVLALTLIALVQRPATQHSALAPMAQKVEEKNSPLSPPESLMDVSSPGDQAVGDDGVTLPETDSEIKLRQ
jgi:hypothetical protein